METFFRSAPMSRLRRILERHVDFDLNYGRDIIREYAQLVGPVTTILDIGAGTGKDLQICRAAQPSARLTALECQSENVSHLHAQGIDTYPVDLECERFPFDSEEIDLVIANQILEHVKQIFWILHEVTRVIRVGGHLIVGVPNLASLHNRLILLLGMQPTPINTFSAHLRGFTRHDFLRLLSSCWPGGYYVTAYRGSNFYPFPPAIARPLARALPNLAWGMFLLLEKRRPYQDEFLSIPKAERFETNFYFG